MAGQAGAVTIATNMAGRGTDIKLDDVARNAGGLMIIGTERHESRRIDNQLRGRSGRQGDPGESRFYISLEDDLMRLFGSERLMKIFTSLGVAENEQIEHKMLSNAIEKAQEKIEFNNFGIRKNLLDYDQVNNEQREIIYKERRQVLDGENMREAIYKMIQDTVDTYVDMCFSDDVDSEEWDLNEFNGVLTPIIPIRPLTAESVKGKKRDEIRHELKEQADKLEQQEYVRTADELVQLYIRYSVLNDIPYFYSVSDFFWESGFYESLKSDEKRKYMSFNPLSFDYSRYEQDNTVYDEELPYFSVVVKTIVLERYSS